MKLFKGIALFIVAFLLAWILIFTFSQPPFRQPASAHILTWITPGIPIYLYVLGAFCLGLAAGLFLTLYNYVTLKTRLSEQIRESANLKVQLAHAEALVPSGQQQDPDDNIPSAQEAVEPNALQPIPSERTSHVKK